MKKFTWDEDCQKAFENLKSFLTQPPLLSRPIAGEMLYLYLSVGKETIASVLVREEGEEQQPIYYVGRTLKGAELNYPTIDKLTLAVVVTTKKLKPYFQGHTVIVPTNQPLRKALHHLETSGRLVSWSVQLGEHDIRYEPRKTLKAQALADFVAEMTEKPPDSGAGAGIVLLGPQTVVIEHAVHLKFRATNNVAEYEAFLTGLTLAKEVKAEKLRIHSDSQLVTSQILGQFQTKDANMAKYMERAKVMLKEIERNGGKWEIIPIPRERNMRADALAKAAAIKSPMYLSLYMKEERVSPIIDEKEILPITEIDPWMQPIVAYLNDGTIPEGREAAAKLEIHEGECGAHEGAASLSRKALLLRYYWPTMKKDAEAMVKKCDKCQRFGTIIRTPAAHQSAIGSPWPFMTWGVDILGPFTPARGQVKFIVVAVDHFTKWMEVQPMTTITSHKIINWLSMKS
ncbi:uncharacterized protein LOC126668871 [Mercurialis annua]|uniref:uncharacterized protein LOC126668871 n=1 Tax=Mercurialis annua TaxID=3986 RepID=UPI002160C9EE|nr:uncharacterized protein LOC126668871 [Mercurialis annua]